MGVGQSKAFGLQIANVGALAVTIIANLLSNILRTDGKNVGEISDAYPNLFTPAGYVFSIWGIIYALLLLFTVYQSSPKRRGELFLHKIGYYFVLSCVANVIWLYLWLSEQIVVSLVPMFVLLGSLIVIYLRLQIGRSEAPRNERLLIHLPFSVYLGWITVAPIANVAAALTAIGWDGWGINETYWAVLVIAVAVIITTAVIATRKDVAFSLVIIWALTGILTKQIENQLVSTTAGLGAIAIALVLASILLATKGRKVKKQAGSALVSP